MPGSEQALHEYIDALGRGAPNYDDMTPQVAVYELRRHDAASGRLHAPAIAAQPGGTGQTWDVAGNVVPRRYGERQ
jgi:hypothetical protein